MKKIHIAYWIITGLFAAFMLFSAWGDAVSTKEAVDFMNGKLGYPVYIIPFIGWAKILGVIAILVPGFPRIKEWAYAGLVFDLAGATYSFVALGGEFAGGIVFMLITIAFAFASYFLYHARLKAAAGRP